MQTITEPQTIITEIVEIKRAEIMQMLNRIDSLDITNFIHIIVSDICKEEGI